MKIMRQTNLGLEPLIIQHPQLTAGVVVLALSVLLSQLLLRKDDLPQVRSSNSTAEIKL